MHMRGLQTLMKSGYDEQTMHKFQNFFAPAQNINFFIPCEQNLVRGTKMTRHEFAHSLYWNNVNSVKIEVRPYVEFVVKPRRKNGEITDAL